MKTAVITICMDSPAGNYNSFFPSTRKTQEFYAKKIGAEYIVITERKVAKTSPHYEKFQIYDLLNKYERIIFLDADTSVRTDCPNLFELVPFHQLGLFNEGDFKDRTYAMQMVCKEYGEEIKEWNGRYYNTGVMVVSRCHKDLFKPPVQEIWNYYEQSYLNLRIINDRIDCFHLDYKFNRMAYLDEELGEHRLCSYIIHYAGIQKNLKEIIDSDIDRWNSKEHHILRRNIAIGAGANVGDVVVSEPIVRYVLDKFSPESQVTVITEYPRVFEHLTDRIKLYKFGQEVYERDTPYVYMNTMVKPDHPINKTLNPSYMHVTDFMTLLCFGRQIPDIDKQIKLKTSKKGEQELADISDKTPDVIVHPGQGWASKTFPDGWWASVIEKLSKQGLVVGVIGKTMTEKQNVQKFEVGENVIDYRDLLSLDGLISIVSRTKTLLSNDSAPVHVAGAFDNNIVVIPTCKHPDLFLPYRKGSKKHKVTTLYNKILFRKYDPISKWKPIETLDGHIEDYLPKQKDVVESVLKLHLKE